MPPFFLGPIFTLVILIALIVGGVALLRPVVEALSRGLGKRLEPGPGRGVEGSDLIPILRRIEERMDAIEGQQERLREHQEFLDALLEKRDPPRIADKSAAEGEEEG